MKKMMKLMIVLLTLVLGMVTAQAQGVNNAPKNGCKDIGVTWLDLRNALTTAAPTGAVGTAQNGGFGLNMWGTIVDRDGVVCFVAFTGSDRGQQWPGSRVISAQKANTANAFSLPGLALSTANLYTATQPGGSLFGLQLSNPVSTDVAYSGNPAQYGQANDPMVGGRIGGINVFGGGLALYNKNHEIVGGLGVSGDSSCADHNIAYRTRHTLNLDFVPAGVGDATHKDNIIFDVTPQGNGDALPITGAGQMPGVSAGGFGHASCHGYNTTGNATSAGFAAALPATQ